jgi:DNA-binding transcriptional LysR family regulator
MLALQAATSGLGIALEGDFLASEELAAGRLVRTAVRKWST